MVLLTDNDQLEVTSDTGPFVIIPAWLLSAPVSDKAKLVYAVLADYADREGVSWPSRTTIAGRLGCSTKTVDRALDELQEIGAITAKPQFKGGSQSTNLYTVYRSLPPWTQVSPPLDTGDPHGGDTGVQPPLDMGVAQNQTHLEPENNGARSAHALVAYYVDQYRSATGVDPPSAWKGAAGREVKRAMLDYPDHDIQRGLYFAAHQSKNPGGLLSYISEYHRMKRQQRRTTR